MQLKLLMASVAEVTSVAEVVVVIDAAIVLFMQLKPLNPLAHEQLYPPLGKIVHVAPF